MRKRKSKEEKDYIKDIKQKQRVIAERVELLEFIHEENKNPNGVSMIKLGGLVDDVTLINPASQARIAELLLEIYREEQTSFAALIANYN